MNRAVQQGLTIIELMIIVTVVGILATVTIPKYQDYKVTEKVRDAVNLANPALTALAVACSTGKLYGANNESLGLSPAETYSGDSTRSIAAAGVSPTEGVVTITLKSIAGRIDDGQRIVYTRFCDVGPMTWTVSGDVAPKYLPKI